MLLNVKGLNPARKRWQVFRLFHKVRVRVNDKFDVKFLQETYSSDSIEEIRETE